MQRIEEDLLGGRELPADAYYGIQTLRASENFPISGMRVNPRLVAAIATVKRACAEATRRLGYLEDATAKAIITAVDDVLAGRLDDAFVVDAIQGGAGTSLHMNVNEVIANRATELLGGRKGEYLVQPNNDVNMAQSTNDVVPTAVHITLIGLLDEVQDALSLLGGSLARKGEELDAVLKVGRTHLQDAVPIRMGQEFGAYSKAIFRDVRRFELCREDLLKVNIGATAVGTGLNADLEYIKIVVAELRRLTGYDLTSSDDLVDATQNYDRFVDLSGRLRTAAVNLIKIANDLRLMASGPRSGFGEIRLPAVQPGSSIMPGKVNPVIPEVVNQVAFHILGNDQTVMMAAQAGQFELNVMGPVLAHNLVQSLEILRNAASTFTERCIKGITADEGRCESEVSQSVGVATALNPILGYKTASRIAKEAVETGKSVREIVLERDLLTAEVVDRVLAPHAMTSPGRSSSGLKEAVHPHR